MLRRGELLGRILRRSPIGKVDAGGNVQGTPALARALGEVLDEAATGDSLTGDLKMTFQLGDRSGWLVANGRTLRKAQYPDLYRFLAGQVSETEDTFDLPNLRDRFPVGAGAYAPLLGTGGTEQTVLSVDNLPDYELQVTDPGHDHETTQAPHVHTLTMDPHDHTVTDPGHQHQAHNHADGSKDVEDAMIAPTPVPSPAQIANTGTATTGITIDEATTTGDADEAEIDLTINTASTGISVSSGGGGEAIRIIPPSIGVNWLIKT